MAKAYGPSPFGVFGVSERWTPLKNRGPPRLPSIGKLFPVKLSEPMPPEIQRLVKRIAMCLIAALGLFQVTIILNWYPWPVLLPGPPPLPRTTSSMLANGLFLCVPLFSLFVFWRHGRKERRDKAWSGRCISCGYDVRGLPNGSPCPECGSKR